jgi:hypothetical protein
MAPVEWADMMLSTFMMLFNIVQQDGGMTRGRHAGYIIAPHNCAMAAM